jgi:molybdenum cofactor biosynthesis enzyme MoaA
MTKYYSRFPRRAGALARWGLLAIFVGAVFLFWPSKVRRIEHRLSTLAAAVSHEGPAVTSDWLKTLQEQIQTNCSTSTTEVTIDSVVNEALSQEQIVQGVAQLAANSVALRVRFEHLSVELTPNQERAQVSADAIVEMVTQNRADREKRHVTFSLQQRSGEFRIVAVEASANIVNQPEPRP